MSDTSPSLAEQILEGVKDDVSIANLVNAIDGPSPLQEVVTTYQTLSLQDDALPDLTSDSTGRDLKDAIERLEPEAQVAILARYSHATMNLTTPTTYDPKVLAAETKALRHTVYLLGAVLLSIIIAILIGAVIVTGVHMQLFTAGAAISTLLTTAKDVVELLLNMHAG